MWSSFSLKLGLSVFVFVGVFVVCAFAAVLSLCVRFWCLSRPRDDQSSTWSPRHLMPDDVVFCTIIPPPIVALSYNGHFMLSYALSSCKYKLDIKCICISSVGTAFIFLRHLLLFHYFDVKVLAWPGIHRFQWTAKSGSYLTIFPIYLCKAFILCPNALK